ncbi:MAG: hypothetical protein WCC64_09575 [Aliidongia sp.]
MGDVDVMGDMERRHNNVLELACVKEPEGGKIEYWNIKKTDDSEFDQIIGHGVAREVLTLCCDERDASALGAVMHDIIKHGQVDDVVLGFLAEIEWQVTKLIRLSPDFSVD